MPFPPKTIQVGTRRYTVHTDEETYRRVCDQERKELEGNTNHPMEEIMLRPGRGANWTADTLVHEAMHAAFSFHGVNLDNLQRMNIEDVEEYVVSVSSPIWMMIMRDNPDFLAFVLEPEVPWEAEETAPAGDRRE